MSQFYNIGAQLNNNNSFTPCLFVTASITQHLYLTFENRALCDSLPWPLRGILHCMCSRDMSNSKLQLGNQLKEEEINRSLQIHPDMSYTCFFVKWLKCKGRPLSQIQGKGKPYRPHVSGVMRLHVLCKWSHGDKILTNNWLQICFNKTTLKNVLFNGSNNFIHAKRASHFILFLVF